MGAKPQLAGSGQRLDSPLCPPSRFLAGAGQFSVMCLAQRACEFITDLLPKPAAVVQNAGDAGRRAHGRKRGRVVWRQSAGVAGRLVV
jgi:hypothetical protein